MQEEQVNSIYHKHTKNLLSIVTIECGTYFVLLFFLAHTRLYYDNMVIIDTLEFFSLIFFLNCGDIHSSLIL